MSALILVYIDLLTLIYFSVQFFPSHMDAYDISFIYHLFFTSKDITNACVLVINPWKRLIRTPLN